MTERNTTGKQSRFLEVLNGRATSYALLYVMCMLCISQISLLESETVFTITMLSCVGVLIFTIIWNVIMIVKHKPIAQQQGRPDAFFNFATLILFICFSISSYMSSPLLSSVMAYAGAALLTSAFLYLSFHK